MVIYLRLTKRNSISQPNEIAAYNKRFEGTTEPAKEFHNSAKSSVAAEPEASGI